MPTEHAVGSKERPILVAGDICLDVVGVPLQPSASTEASENWRLTGEVRTHFLPGGAMLLAEFMRSLLLASALLEAEKKAEEEIKNGKLSGAKAIAVRRRLRLEALRKHSPAAEDRIIGPRPHSPATISEGNSGALYVQDFLFIAERLRRQELVHSLLSAKSYPVTGDPKEKRAVLRIEREHGYSGPDDSASLPQLKVSYPQSNPSPEIIVLDDTGNTFRRKDPDNPWPAVVESSAADLLSKPLIIYKLHRPLPDEGKENSLWARVAQNHPDNRLIIVSVADLRSAGAPISLGLSWERTALDVVWHLLHFEPFRALKQCPRVVIRLGLDGAILWQSYPDSSGEPRYDAWLIYDPCGIEGSFAQQVPGRMVACGSAFTAALSLRLSGADQDFQMLLQRSRALPREDNAGRPLSDQEYFKVLDGRDRLVLDAITNGIAASRRLLQLGFGNDLEAPSYPGEELFRDASKAQGMFARQRIPIIPDADEPDRSYWRLLDSIFEGNAASLHKAVELVATKRRTPTKDEQAASSALGSVPIASYGALTAYDRSEIENYRSLHMLLRDYLCVGRAQRPLSIGVFGPPGAGKSFGVKQVAASLGGQRDCREVQALTFNLSLYQKPEELAGAFHLVRDVSLRGKVPLVFFDEFDTNLGDQKLGWLRHFLAPMQDGEFLDRGSPHPIGQSIFVFAGGTCSTFYEFAAHPEVDAAKFKALKGPDFLSRLRGTLDIPSLNFLIPSEPLHEGSATTDRQPVGTFNPHGPIEDFPCEASILLRRASILAFSLKEKAPNLVRADGSLSIAPEVLRALLRLPQFAHGNRSFEAVLDMSHLVGAESYVPSLLPAPRQLPLHAPLEHLRQLVATDFPFQPELRDLIAKTVHEAYLVERKAAKSADRDKLSHEKWSNLIEFYRERNRQAVDSIPDKLRAVGLWFRKTPHPPSGTFPVAVAELASLIEKLARAEHDRWVADQRRHHYIYGPVEDHERLFHPDIKPWNELSEDKKRQDREAVAAIPQHLAAASYEVTKA